MGVLAKTVETDAGPLELETPRDREGTFEPQLVKKQQTRFTSMDDRILFLYAKGMSTRDIVATFKELYDADEKNLGGSSPDITLQNLLSMPHPAPCIISND